MCAVKETPSVTTRSGSIVVVSREDHVLPLCALHLKHFHGDSLRDLVKSPTSGKEHQVGAGTTFLTSIAFRALYSMLLAPADYFHVHLRLHESVVSCRPLRRHRCAMIHSLSLEVALPFAPSSALCLFDNPFPCESSAFTGVLPLALRAHSQTKTNKKTCVSLTSISCIA
jgi:hypothetical protein